MRNVILAAFIFIVSAGLGWAQEINVKTSGGTSIVDGGSILVSPNPQGGVATNIVLTIENTHGATALTSLAMATLSQTNVTVGAHSFGATTVPAGGSTTLTIPFTPTEAGSFAFSIEIASDDADENPYNITIAGTASANPEIDILNDTPAAVANGGSFAIAPNPVGGVNNTEVLTVQNNGTTTLNLGTPTFGGASNATVNSVTPAATTVAPGGSTTVSISYRANDTGNFSFNVTIPSDDANESNYSITLTGTANPAVEINVKNDTGGSVASGGTVAVSPDPVGGVATTEVLTIENQGTTTLNLGGATFSSLTRVDATPTGSLASATVAAASSTTLTITYTPSDSGAFSFDVSIPSDDTDENPYVVTITGNATAAPNIVVQDDSLSPIADGGTLVISPNPTGGVGANEVLTIRNNGTTTLNLGTPAVSSTSNVTPGTPVLGSATVAAGGTTTLTLPYTPDDSGAFSFSVQIPSDDPGTAVFDVVISGGANAAVEINLKDDTAATVLTGGSLTVSPNPTGGVATSEVITIENLGTTSLHLFSTAITNTSNVTVSSALFASTNVAAAGSTTLTVSYTPTDAGPFSFDLTVVSDDTDESSYTITVQGTAAIQPEIGVKNDLGAAISDGGTQDVAPNPVGGVLATEIFTIENTGSTTLSLTGATLTPTTNVTVGTATLASSSVAAGASTTLTVTYTPNDSGTFQFELDITSDDADEANYDVTVRGTADPDPRIGVKDDQNIPIADGGALLIAPNPVGGVGTTEVLTITNTGTTTMTLTSATTSAANNVTIASAVFGAPTLAAGASTTLTISYTPNDSGAFSFALDIVTDATNAANFDIAVSGTASAAVEINVQDDSASNIADGGALAIAPDPVGGVQTTEVLTIQNTGTTTLHLSSVTVTNTSNVTVATTTFASTNVAAGGSTTLTITYTPTTNGAFGFDLDIGSDDTDENPYDIAVSGTAVAAPEINLKDDAGTTVLTGGTVTINPNPVGGVSTTEIITIENLGTTPLNLGAVTTAALSRVTVASTVLGATVVAPGASTTLTVTYTPTDSGAFSFNVIVASDDADEPSYTVTLQATASEAPEINTKNDLGGGISDGGALVITPNPTGGVAGATEVLTIENLGTTTLNLGTPTTSAETNVTVTSLVLGSATVAAGASTTLTITYTPTDSGVFTFNLDIPSNDADEAVYDISVAGTGAPAVDINVQDDTATNVLDGGTLTVAPNPTGGSATTEVLTIQNTGTTTLTLISATSTNSSNATVTSLVFGTNSVAAGGSTTLTVSYVPIDSGAFSFDLDIVSDDPDESVYDVKVQGTADEATAINVKSDVGASIANTGAHVVAPNPTGGVQTTEVFTIENNGATTLTLTSATVTATSNVAGTSTTFAATSIAPGGSTTLTVTYTPSDGLPFNFELTIVSSSTSIPSYLIHVSGTANANPEIDVTNSGGASIADGGTLIITPDPSQGVATNVTATIKNLGTTDLTVSGITTANTSNVTINSVTGGTGTITPGASATVTINYTVTAAGAFSFDLDIVSDDADEANYDILVTGGALLTAEINVKSNTGASIADGGGHVIVGNKLNGSAHTEVLTIENLGALTLNVSSVTSNTPVNVTVNSFTPTAASIAAGGSTTLTITYTPTIAGPFSFNLVINSDDADEAAYNIAISGTAGTAPEINLKDDAGVSVLTGGTLTVSPRPTGGAATNEVITIENLGTAILNLTSVTASNPANVTVHTATFTSMTVAASGSTSLTVNYTPTTAGTFSFDLSVKSDDTDENPYVITVTGTINGSPTVSAGADTTAVEGEAVALTATASDPDGDALTYTWTQTAGTTVVMNNAGTASMSFMAPSVYTTTVLTFQVSVSDGITSAVDTVNVTISVSSSRSQSAASRTLSSVINKQMARFSSGLYSKRSASRLNAGRFTPVQNLNMSVSNLDQVDDFLMDRQSFAAQNGWVSFTSDDILADIKRDRQARIANALEGLGVDYDPGADPLDPYLADRKSGFDAYTAFGFGLYNKDGTAGYDGTGAYVTLGADYLLEETLLLGGAFGFESNTLDFNVAQNGSLKKSGSHIDLYSAFYFEDLVYFESMLSYGGYTNDITANSVSGTTDSRAFKLSVKSGFDLDAGNISVEPWGQIFVTNEDFDGYTASDGSVVSDFSVETANGRVGVDVGVNQPIAGMFEPYAGLSLDFDLSGANDVILSNGAKFVQDEVSGTLKVGGRVSFGDPNSGRFYGDMNIENSGLFTDSSATLFNFKLGYQW